VVGLQNLNPFLHAINTLIMLIKVTHLIQSLWWWKRFKTQTACTSCSYAFPWQCNMEYKGPRSWAGPGMTKHTLSPQVSRLPIKKAWSMKKEESKEQTHMQTKALVSLMKGGTSLFNRYNTHYRVPIWWASQHCFDRFLHFHTSFRALYASDRVKDSLQHLNSIISQAKLVLCK